jgi:dihydrolipoamide dehydrogenase
VDQIMPVEDTEIAGIARKQLEKQGMKIMTGAKVPRPEKGGE